MLVLALKFSRGERNVVCKAQSRRHSQWTTGAVLQILATTQQWWSCVWGIAPSKRKRRL